MSDATDNDRPAHAEPTSVAAAMSEAVIASTEHPHRFDVVFEQYHRTIYEYLARAVGPDRADEYAGDVFVAAFDARVRYDPELGSVRGWLFGIAANIRRNRARSEGRSRRAWDRVGAERDTDDGGFEVVEESLDYGKELAWVAEFLRQLSEIDRDVLVLYAWGELTYPEIAQALGVEIGTVRSRLARARGRLRELISGSGEVLDRRAESADGED
ncbi:MAG TPA: sigma-70 family RNA polymerase sigma factor [Acidimicrobiia bacterium]